MTHLYDVAVVGAGAMGSAAAWALAHAGRDVVVLEQFTLGHELGGSHGATRIFRVGSEQAEYVELAERSRRLWRELEAESGEVLLTVTGTIEHGISHESAQSLSSFFTGRDVEHEILDPGEAGERWGGMRFDGPVLHQPDGGCILADRAVAALQRIAIRRGATVHCERRVRRLRVAGSATHVELDTESGPVHARHVIVTAGPWATPLLDGIVELPRVTVTQEQPRHFSPVDASHRWPSFVHWRRDKRPWGRHESYGLFEAGAGVKVGLHAAGPEVDPDRRDFAVEPARDEALKTYVSEWFPGLDPERSAPISCVYDNTEGCDFVIDRVGPITVATGFNGQGFKFVPAVGQLLRDLALGAATPPPRFTLAAHAAVANRAGVH